MAKTNECPKEAYEQQKFCKWLDDHGITYFAIPNQTYRKMPKNAPYIGVKPGVPDIMICQQVASKYEGSGLPKHNFLVDYPCREGCDIVYAGLFIEMKRQKRSYPSLDQKIWIKKLNEKGYVAKVAHGCVEAIAITKEYLGMED